MFQSFESQGDPTTGPERVRQLREWLAAHGLDGFLVPRADEHQGEYVAPGSERLRWLSGFSGSAGVALILRERAHIFVDGRYTLQVRDQTDPSIFTIESLVETPPPAWIEKHLGKGARVGFDPRLHTISDAEALRKATEKAGATLVAVERNPIDELWTDRPAPPLGAIEIQPIAYAGELARDKLARLAAKLTEEGVAHAVLTDPSSVAWSFNIRGSDVLHAPLPLCFAILSAEGLPYLFVDEAKLGIEAKAYLTQLAELRPPSELDAELARLAAGSRRIGLDPALAAEHFRVFVEASGGTYVKLADPARLPRATKNAAEIAGTRAAHRRDGTAVTKMLAWLGRQQPGTIDEISAVTKLEELRRATGEETQMPLREVSFDTIAGAGPNGAIMHYRVSRGTNRKLEAGELFLLDSGAQYQDGTTDITRTVAVGEPTEEMRERYTIVLKGMIGISMLRFPSGTRGADIDAVARMAHWKAGVDYAHGTGHGVGSFLSVHEGPQRISRTGTEKLLAGMIISNEPGYYREGAYGIRIENLILVTPAEAIPGGDIAMHGFETLTLAPFDRRLINTELLTREELMFLDAYNARVLSEIGPMVDGETLKWLEAATAPFSHDLKSDA
jgi:Xaa-Pro aminopeptidase